MASELRNVELSVDLRVWAILRQQGWCIAMTGMPLAPAADASLPPHTYAASDGMPWCFLDTDGNVANDVTVYDGGVAIHPTDFVVDFRHGRVTLNRAPSGPVTADVTVSAAHVVEGYPDDEWLKRNNLPVVAWTNTMFNGEAFAVGTSLEDRHFFFTIDVIANNRGECSDLLSDLSRFIVKLPLFNMTAAQPLDGDGGVDPKFDDRAQYVEDLRMARKPRGERIPPRQSGVDKERHRGVIAFQVDRVS